MIFKNAQRLGLLQPSGAFFLDDFPHEAQCANIKMNSYS
jgi:hypothetical protein